MYHAATQIILLLALGSPAQRDGFFRQQWEKCVSKCNIPTAKSSGKLRMLTGLAPPDNSYYFKVGKSIAAAAGTFGSGADRLEIEDIPSCQTTCNLWGLLTGNAELALVQSDVAHDAWFGHPPVSPTASDQTALEKIRLVAQLYVEAVHVLVRPHLNVARLADFKGRRVWLGPKDSFTVLSSRRILNAAGLSPEEIEALENQCPRPAYVVERPGDCAKVRDLSRSEALNKLANLEIDAMFQVGAIPLDPVRDVLVPNSGVSAGQAPCSAIRKARLKDSSFRDQEIRLFNLDVDLVGRLVQDGSFIEQLIPPEHYCQEKAVLTVGVRSLLLTNQNSKNSSVTLLANALFRNTAVFEQALRKRVEDEQRAHGDPITGMPSKLGLLRVDTPDSLRVWQINHDERFRPWVKAEVPLLVVGGLIVIGLLYAFRGLIGPLLARRGELLLGMIGLLFAWLAAAFLLNHYEGTLNQEYATFPDAMLTTFLDLFPGSDAPLTNIGQHCWSICKWIGLLIFGGMFLPGIQQALRPRLAGKLKGWLRGLGHKRSKPSGSARQ